MTSHQIEGLTGHLGYRGQAGYWTCDECGGDWTDGEQEHHRRSCSSWTPPVVAEPAVPAYLQTTDPNLYTMTKNGIERVRDVERRKAPERAARQR